MSLNQQVSVQVERTTAFDQVTSELRRRIIEGELAPGSRLQIDALRHQFGVSTSTMREALSRLLADSLVVSWPQIGFTVVSLSKQDCRSIARVRTVLETEAIREALSKRNDAWEAQLAGAFHLLSRADRRLILDGDLATAADWRQRNADFHNAVVATCDNSYLMTFRRVVHLHSDRYRALLPEATAYATDVPRQHQAIFDAAIAGRTEDCVEIMAEHINAAVQIIIDLVPGP